VLRFRKSHKIEKIVQQAAAAVPRQIFCRAVRYFDDNTPSLALTG
jgi:hypothetical protein